METIPTAPLGEVIEHNKGLLARARELNRRAGTAIFTVMDKAALSLWLVTRLGGACRASEVADPDAIKLPELDSAEVARVLAQAPDTICVLGPEDEYTVEYREGATPRIQWLKSTGFNWLRIPDVGVRLPDGRLVEVVVSFGYHTTFAETDIPTLKLKVRTHLNKEQWDRWSAPSLALPDVADEASEVSHIVEVEYGRCVVTNDPLYAYGAVTVRSCRYHNSDPWFEGKWYQNRTQAETALAASESKLMEIRKEIREKAQVEAVRVLGEALKAELVELKSREGWSELEFDLRQRVESRTGYYASLPSGLAELEAWILESQAIKAEVEAALKAKVDAKLAEEARIVAAELSGHLVRKLEVTCDTRYGRGHVWVIRPDGTVREHDGYGDAGRRRYTCYVWNMISDELVIASGVDSVQGGGLITSGTGIVWQPKETTPAQVATVERLEGEHSLGGTFEVDPSLVAKRAKMMEEVRKEILRVSPKENVLGLQFLEVAGADGYQLRELDPRRLVNWASPFTQRCEGRDAQLVKAVRCADGMVEFVAYDKWGMTNLNVRWRTLTEEEQVAPPPVPTPTSAPRAVPSPKAQPALSPAPQPQISGGGHTLADLAAKFGRR